MLGFADRNLDHMHVEELKGPSLPERTITLYQFHRFSSDYHCWTGNDLLNESLEAMFSSLEFGQLFLNAGDYCVSDRGRETH